MEQRVVSRIQQIGASHPGRARAVAGAALAVSVALVLARANPMRLVFLQDHPLSSNAALVPAALLVLLAVTLLFPPGRQSRRVAFAASVVITVLFCGGALALETPDASVRRGHHLADDVFTADGRYELRVSRWDYGPGQAEWQVLVERRGAIRFVAVDAGCLSEAVTAYRGVASFEPGHARLATDRGVVDIGFDVETMRVTDPLPAELCPGD